MVRCRTTGVPHGCLLLESGRSPLANLFQEFLSIVDRHVGRMSAAEIEGTRNALLVLIAGMIRASRADVGDSEFLGREFRREFSLSPGDYREAHGFA